MHSPRLVFLGLDGLPWSTANALCSQGVLPNLATLMTEAGCTAINAELPELSPVNWTSLFTASPPGHHGVFGFTRIDPHSYQLHFTDFTHVHGPTIFERFADHGTFAKVINMPNLAPVRPVRAMLVAGFPAESLTGSVHPPTLGGILQDHEYTIEANTIRGATDPAFLLEELHRTLNCREKAFDLLWDDLAWDQFFFILTETDRLGHFLFPAIENSLHPWHSDCINFLQAWDWLIGKVLTRYHDLKGSKRLIVMADHGFTTLEQEVDLNVWLREQGLLRMASRPASEWDAGILTPSTKAFALDPGRIYLHTRERFSRGQVSPSHVQGLVREIGEALTALTCQGRKVIRQVHSGPELYHGPQAHRAPDLVLVPEPGFDLKGKFDRLKLFGHYGRQGMHTAHDVFYYDSLQETATTPTDVGRNILAYYGINATRIEF